MSEEGGNTTFTSCSIQSSRFPFIHINAVNEGMKAVWMNHTRSLRGLFFTRINFINCSEFMAPCMGSFRIHSSFKLRHVALSVRYLQVSFHLLSVTFLRPFPSFPFTQSTLHSKLSFRFWFTFRHFGHFKRVEWNHTEWNQLTESNWNSVDWIRC